ncbi:hypothetical protein HGA88_01840, partial [Candidatus Roizmanbacteria bacterium]|nr:hypothetical protein [Candidatus Roizmanbacteria bacterium]
MIEELTPQQQKILLLIYTYRFLDRSHIQQFLQHKSHQKINLWLSDMTSKGYLEKKVEIDTTFVKHPTLYFIAPKRLAFLRERTNVEVSKLEKLWRETEKTKVFIDKHLFIANFALHLKDYTYPHKLDQMVSLQYGRKKDEAGTYTRIQKTGSVSTFSRGK